MFAHKAAACKHRNESKVMRLHSKYPFTHGRVRAAQPSRCARAPMPTHTAFQQSRDVLWGHVGIDLHTYTHKTNKRACSQQA